MFLRKFVTVKMKNFILAACIFLHDFKFTDQKLNNLVTIKSSYLQNHRDVKFNAFEEKNPRGKALRKPIVSSHRSIGARKSRLCKSVARFFL